MDSITTTITPEILGYLAMGLTALLSGLIGKSWYSNAKKFITDVTETLQAIVDVNTELINALEDDSISADEITAIKEKARKVATEASELLGYATSIWSVMRKKL